MIALTSTRVSMWVPRTVMIPPAVATVLIEQGVDISVVLEIFGHSQLTTTKRYTPIPATLSTEAAARMGRALWG